MESFELLTDADLDALAAALRSGRLVPPFTEASLQRYSSAQHAGQVAAYLQKLADEGMSAKHAGLLLQTITQTRRRHPQGAEVVDLVWTGPETRGITNRDTAVVVNELFGSAESEVLVAGFAVYQGRTIFRRLADRMNERPALRVRLFLDVQRHPSDTTLADDLLRRFAIRFRTQEWPGERQPELYFDPRSLDVEAAKRSSLHAKCIVVDRRVTLVTSANFTEAAQSRNIEVGALIRCGQFAVRLIGHFDALLDSGAVRQIDF